MFLQLEKSEKIDLFYLQSHISTTSYQLQTLVLPEEPHQGPDFIGRSPVDGNTLSFIDSTPERSLCFQIAVDTNGDTTSRRLAADLRQVSAAPHRERDLFTRNRTRKQQVFV